MPPDSNPERSLPKAVPVKREVLRRARLELHDLPVAQLEEPVEEEVDLDSESNEAETQSEPAAESDTGAQDSNRTPAFQQPPVQEAASINRKALESTNRGRKPSSRFFVRGILHPVPLKMILAAFFAIVFQLSFVVFLVVMALFALEKMDAREYWWLAVICPVAGLFYLIFANQARCRVCGQKEFLPSGAHKHVKTHRFLFFGPIFSTAVHLLTFKWIHCMFCGTAVRIKK